MKDKYQQSFYLKFEFVSNNRGVTFHSLLVTRCKITRYLLQNLLFKKSSSLQKITRYSLQKLLVAKNYWLLIAKNHSLFVAEVARCKKLLVTHCKTHSLLVAEVARYKESLVSR